MLHDHKISYNILQYHHSPQKCPSRRKTSLLNGAVAEDQSPSCPSPSMRLRASVVLPLAESMFLLNGQNSGFLISLQSCTKLENCTLIYFRCEVWMQKSVRKWSVSRLYSSGSTLYICTVALQYPWSFIQSIPCPRYKTSKLWPVKDCARSADMVMRHDAIGHHSD